MKALKYTTSAAQALHIRSERTAEEVAMQSDIPTLCREQAAFLAARRARGIDPGPDAVDLEALKAGRPARMKR